MNTTIEKTIGEMVAEDYRTAAVFGAFGIDFCCKGNKTLDDVCQSKGIQKNLLLQDLAKATQVEDKNTMNYNNWPLDLLADYIEKKHHRYVEEKIPLIKQYLEKICAVHGEQHPELFKIRELFLESASELTVHMKKEELVLFPFVRKLMALKFERTAFRFPPFGSVKNPVKMMKHDHDSEGERFRIISELSNHYTPPADACNTYKVTFSLLKEFEADLHTHIHLENNILFPKSIEMENEIARFD